MSHFKAAGFERVAAAAILATLDQPELNARELLAMLCCPRIPTKPGICTSQQELFPSGVRMSPIHIQSLGPEEVSSCIGLEVVFRPRASLIGLASLDHQATDAMGPSR